MKKWLTNSGACWLLVITASGNSYAGVTADGTTAYVYKPADQVIIFTDNPSDDPDSTDAPLGAGEYTTGGCRSLFGGFGVEALICVGGPESTVSTYDCRVFNVVNQAGNSWCLFAENPRIGNKAWAVKYTGGIILTNDETSIVRCEGSDTFDPATGCTPAISLPTQIRLEGGYMQLDLKVDQLSDLDCDEPAESGRMIVNDIDDLLYICTQSGWGMIPISPLP